MSNNYIEGVQKKAITYIAIFIDQILNIQETRMDINLITRSNDTPQIIVYTVAFSHSATCKLSHSLKFILQLLW